MTAHFTIRNEQGQIIENHATDSIATADLIARALAFQHPGAEVEIEFKAA